MQTHLKHLVNYNLWANKKFVEVLVNINYEVLDKEIVSSFSSIRKTVFHIWDAEFIWLKRLQGISLNAFPSSNYTGETAIDKFLECSEEFANTVNEADLDFFEKRCTYKQLSGKEFTNSHTQIIMHCMNHSTFHRGQLITMFRQIGITTLPKTDLIEYFRENNL